MHCLVVARRRCVWLWATLCFLCLLFCDALFYCVGRWLYVVCDCQLSFLAVADGWSSLVSVLRGPLATDASVVVEVFGALKDFCFRFDKAQVCFFSLFF